MTEDTISSLMEEIMPPEPPGAMKWIRDNLFSTILNSSMTVILIPSALWVLYLTLRWAFYEADWTPITGTPLLFIVGQYPREELWRVAFSFAGVVFLMGASWGKWGGLLRTIALWTAGLFTVFAFLPVEHRDLDRSLYTLADVDITVRIYLGLAALTIFAGYALGRLKSIKAIYIIAGWLIMPIIMVIIISGFGDSELLPAVSQTLWGGLLVTFFLSFGGILLSFPIGVALALGRRSSLPVVKAFSTIIIETIRGVPLVTILFMFSFILILLLPPDITLKQIWRALMAVTMFSAAYTAENVRGGLQAVPPGQVEAAKAVGMSGWKIVLLIELPQAIRAILPAIVGQFIALFKDTTLVVIVGINDFLGMGKVIIKSKPEYLQLQLEVYLFVGLVYMLFSYLMSTASRR
ncbi:MAG: amino acid ABC transporter permease, partial [Chloroflexi bacterium]|nr:amino acid ABC transporter permease [Chloroflexota bacterium]